MLPSQGFEFGIRHAIRLQSSFLEGKEYDEKMVGNLVRMEKSCLNQRIH